MIDSNNKLKSLSKSLIESAKKIMSEKKSERDLAKLAPPYDKVTHGDVLVGRKVYTHDQVAAHKAKKGIKEDADMVVVNAPVLADINGELAEVLKRDPRDKTVHIQLEGMKYILKKGQYEELPEAVKNPYAVGMAAAMKSTGDKPPLKKSTIVKGHEIAKGIMKNEEVEDLDELSKSTLASYIGKAATSAANKASEHGRKSAERDEMDRMMNRHMSFSDKDKVHDIMKTSYRAIEEPREKVGKRIQGIKRATARLAKEDVELTQEEIENIEAILADLDEGKWNYPKHMTKTVTTSDMDTTNAARNREERKAFRKKEKAKAHAALMKGMRKEEVELDEGRGRPPKEGSAAWHAKQKQDLADMPALSVQIRKAASMNKPVTFMDGKSHEISQHHIDKFHDHMDARKTTQDKAAFQKRAHKSHDEFKKAVSEPVPSSSKDTGEIVKYR